jgi:hypothetical protein
MVVHRVLPGKMGEHQEVVSRVKRREDSTSDEDDDRIGRE